MDSEEPQKVVVQKMMKSACRSCLLEVEAVLEVPVVLASRSHLDPYLLAQPISSLPPGRSGGSGKKGNGSGGFDGYS